MRTESAGLAPILLAAAIGVAAGIGLGFLTPIHRSVAPSSEPTSPPGAQGEAPALDGCTEQTERTETTIAKHEEELELYAFQEQLLRSQLSMIGGLPSDWPADLEPTWEAATVQERIRTADRDTPGVDVIGFDCEEFPCLALFVMDGSVGPVRGVSSAAADPLVADWPGLQRTTVSAREREDGTTARFGVMSLGPGDDREPLLRTKVRMDRALRALRDEEAP